MSNKIVVVAGPTATGKTRLGIELAQALGGEIVSADSMQVYRGMDIGTAKADAAERAAAPHHMLDVVEPSESYSVARYAEEARRVCEELLARGRMPIVVGGTGLYIDALIDGRDFAEFEGDKRLRTELSALYDAEGGEALLRMLGAFDPERAAKLHPGDRRRIIRAIEIYRLTGETATAHDLATRQRPKRFDAARIDRRVEDMVAAGLFEEVEGLLEGGLSADCTAMQAIGYKEAAQHLRGELSRDEAIALIQQGSRRYAKRQITWFGRWEDALRILWDREPDFQDALLSSTAFLRSRGYAVFV